MSMDKQRGTLLAMHRGAPLLGPKFRGQVIYIDNFACLSVVAEAALEEVSGMLSSLVGAGVLTHMEPAGSPLLGFQITPSRGGWEPTPKKCWQVAYSPEEVGAGRRAVTRKEMMRLLGHTASLFSIKPELFATLRMAYHFADKGPDRRTIPWRSAREELRAAWSLLPLARTSARMQWSPSLIATDASLSGMGVMVADVGSEVTGCIGRVSERARFRGEMRTTRAPRMCLDEFAAPGETEIGELSDDLLLTLGRRAQFPEVPTELVESAAWRCIAARKWRRRELITANESEAAVWAVRALARDATQHGRRHLIVSDSMGWVCAATKGISSRPRIRPRCAELAALSLATQSLIVFRWPPGEHNPADAPSRRFDPSSIHHARHREQEHLSEQRHHHSAEHHHFHLPHATNPEPSVPCVSKPHGAAAAREQGPGPPGQPRGALMLPRSPARRPSSTTVSVRRLLAAPPPDVAPSYR